MPTQFYTSLIQSFHFFIISKSTLPTLCNIKIAYPFLLLSLYLSTKTSTDYSNPAFLLFHIVYAFLYSLLTAHCPKWCISLTLNTSTVPFIYITVDNLKYFFASLNPLVLKHVICAFHYSVSYCSATFNFSILLMGHTHIRTHIHTCVRTHTHIHTD